MHWQAFSHVVLLAKVSWHLAPSRLCSSVYLIGCDQILARIFLIFRDAILPPSHTIFGDLAFALDSSSAWHGKDLTLHLRARPRGNTTGNISRYVANDM